MHKQRAIVWFRQDLRLHDNEALTKALAYADEVVLVYVFDERTFMGKTRWFGFPKTGKFRAKFIIESIADLRHNIRSKGAELIIRIGKPEEVIFDLAKQLKTSWVFCNRERTQEELEVQDKLEKSLWTIGQELHYSRGKMLYYTADLPFPVPHTPDTFTQFRKEVEKITPIRNPLPTPDTLPGLSISIDRGEIPSLADFGLDDFQPDERSVIAFEGGETAALKRLHYYFRQTDLASNYKEERNGLIGGDYSTKFSPWLSQGCLSPKLIYYELKQYERQNGANDSTYWIFFELLWRDFFRFMAKKHGNQIFLKGGLKGEVDPRWQNDNRLLNKWIAGETGIPFIDANMLELKHTGWMSNRGRQNVASFLTKDLNVNWQMGAEYFESVLIDYDVASNWGNWNYVAGVGSDPRENRYFNIFSQACRYDPKGDYVKIWIPELAHIPSERIHQGIG
ncbi:MAG TPA: DASH family cryptochrome [Saprospiraceae bacterium]|nr:DASH family cryptochrome [Saprospiraceae bacterium]HMQ81370.1 DASH family cryptochrome [Saprospiraceae bacterium]